MRPHRLSFTGIGPYPSQVEIDFDELTTLGLYLIVGPTGAGKTTIFDAITYALFGKLAGVRSSQPIISDHDNASAPIVELEFTHRGRRYTVTRKPAPPGKSSRPNDHVLSAHAADGHPSHPDPAAQGLKVTGATRVTTEIESILGLDASQFNRVMLLPQNEFQQFLLANSSDKEKLLRSLFDTDLFHRTEDELERVAKQFQTDAEEANRQLAFTRSQVTSEHDLLVDSGLLVVAEPDDPASADSASAEPSDIETEISLEDLRSEVTALHATAVSESEILTGQSHAATEARLTAEDELRRHRASLQLNEMRTTARELEPVLQHEMELMRGHADALTIVNEVQRRDSAAEHVADAVRRLSTARATASTRISPLTSLHPLIAQLHDNSQHALPAALAATMTNLGSTVNASAERHASVASARERSAARLSRHANIVAEIPVLTERLQRADADLESQRKLFEDAQTAALNLGDLRSEVESLQRLELSAETSAHEGAVFTAQAEFEAAALTADAAQSALDSGLTARTRFLAGELAQTLNSGEPCPVCGSCEHPTLAPMSPDAPDNVALAADRDRTHDLRMRAESELERRLAALELAQQAAAELPPLAERERIRSSYAAAEEAGRRIPELSATVRQLGDEIAALRTDIATKQAEADRAISEAEQAEQDASELLQRAEIASEHLADLSRLLKDLDGFANEVQGLVDLRARHEPIQKDAAERVKELLETSGFADEAGALSAILDDVTRQQFVERAAEAEDRKQRIAHLEGVIGDRPVLTDPPDLEALTAAESEIQSQSRAASEAVTQLADSKRRLTAIADSLAQLGPAAQLKVNRAARFREIVTIIRNGRMPHFALERWVQRAIFTDVCQVASERIKVLSAGRYLLTLDAEDGRTKAHAAGLDLYVTDSHTGRTRPVQTLSGGEQFLTSLALALALADVVQQMSGGVELASLFIDEGFGSLDAETLDTAVDVLRSLQDSGRAVGVISHVEAMQNDLPVGIRVSPAPTGSSISFPTLNTAS